jgi:hypothetical protein
MRGYMQEKPPIYELSDEELEGVVGGSGRSTLTPTGSSSIGTSVNTTAFAVGGRVNRALAVTDSNTILTSEGKGLSFAFGFAVALEL